MNLIIKDLKETDTALISGALEFLAEKLGNDIDNGWICDEGDVEETNEVIESALNLAEKMKGA